MSLKLMLALILLCTYCVLPSMEGSVFKLHFNNVTISFNESTSAPFQDCLIHRAGCLCEMKSDNSMFNVFTTSAGGTKSYCNETLEATMKVCTFNIFNSGITLRYVHIVCQPTIDECSGGDAESGLCWPVCWAGSSNIKLTNSTYGNCFLQHKISLNQTNGAVTKNEYSLTTGSNHGKVTESLQHVTLTDDHFLFSFKNLNFISYSATTQLNELITSQPLHPSISSIFTPSTMTTLMSSIHLTTSKGTPALTKLSFISIGLTTASDSNVVPKNPDILHNELSLLLTNSLGADLNSSFIASITSFSSLTYISPATGQFQTGTPVTYTGASSSTLALVLNLESNYKNNKSSNTLYDQVAQASDDSPIVIILSITLGVVSVSFTAIIIVFLIRRNNRHHSLAASRKTKVLKTESQISSNRTHRNPHVHGDVEIKSLYSECTPPDIISCISSMKTSTEPVRTDKAAASDSVEYDYIDDSKSNDYGPFSSISNSNDKIKVIANSATVNPYAVVPLALTHDESWTPKNLKSSIPLQLENNDFFLLDKDKPQNASDSNSEITTVSKGSKINSNSECETVSADSSFYYMINIQQEKARSGKITEDKSTSVDSQFPFSRLKHINRSFEDICNYNGI